MAFQNLPFQESIVTEQVVGGITRRQEIGGEVPPELVSLPTWGGLVTMLFRGWPNYSGDPDIYTWAGFDQNGELRYGTHQAGTTTVAYRVDDWLDSGGNLFAQITWEAGSLVGYEHPTDFSSGILLPQIHAQGRGIITQGALTANVGPFGGPTTMMNLGSSAAFMGPEQDNRVWSLEISGMAFGSATGNNAHPRVNVSRNGVIVANLEFGRLQVNAGLPVYHFGKRYIRIDPAKTGQTIGFQFYFDTPLAGTCTLFASATNPYTFTVKDEGFANTVGWSNSGCVLV